VIVMMCLLIIIRKRALVICRNRHAVILRLLGSGQLNHRHVAGINSAYRFRLSENVTKEFPHHVIARIHNGIGTIQLVVSNAKDKKSGRNMKGVDVRFVVVSGGGQTEKTFEIGPEIKVEQKFGVVHVETQRGASARRIDAQLRSMGETVGLVLLLNALQRKRLQTRHADVTMVFVTIRDESRQILHPHIVVQISPVRRIYQE